VRTKSKKFTVIADPEEKYIPFDKRIICTGDILRYAPPPHSDPSDSLIIDIEPELTTAYEKKDVSKLLSRIRDLATRPEVKTEAERRYRAFFRDIDQPFYYIAGNQDFPDVLSAVAADFDYVQHVSKLSWCCAIDGMVPSFTNLPADTFPCECSSKQFYNQVESSEQSVLVSHSLPTNFTPEAYGFELAVSSTDEKNADWLTEQSVKLPGYRRTGAVASLFCEPDSTHTRFPDFNMSID